jgi:phage terminase large subunit-like protein
VTEPETRADDQALRDRMVFLSPGQRARFVESLGRDELEAVSAGWGIWGHEGQHAPRSDWRTWIIMAGRGFGKTRAGSEWVRYVARRNPGARIALVAASLDEARAVMVEGESGLLAVAKNDIAGFVATQRKLMFTNGSEALLFSGASPERLRGFQHHFAWCDELAKWQRPGTTWDMLQFGLRLGDAPRTLVTTTPRAGQALVRIMEQPGSVVVRAPTHANPHLPAAFVQAMQQQYGGTRLGRQELDGELLSDVEGALWTVELLDVCRASPGQINDLRFVRTVIGVDPPTGSGTCGIIVCARDTRGIAHVLADHSVTDRPPEAWARAVAAVAEVHGSPAYGRPAIVAERNQGGEMVRAVLRAADAGLRVKLVHAAEGKSARAEPVHTLFEAGRVVIHGAFPSLEAELRGLKGGGGYEAPAWTGPGGPGASPDRADAMVWALTELMLGVRAEPRVRML